MTRRGDGSGETLTSPIDKDGHFDVAGVPAGSWTVAAFHAQGAVQVVGSRAIDVSGQDVDDLAVNASPPADVRGTLRFEGTGIPVLGPGKITVTLAIVESPLVKAPAAEVDQDGNFTLAGPGAGRFRVDVTGLPAGSYLKSVKVDGRDVLAGWEVIDGAAVGNMEIVIGTTGAEVYGVVLGPPDGSNQPGCVVTIAPDPLNVDLVHLFRRTITDQNGQFSFRGLAPGAYRVYAWDLLEAGEQFDPDLLKAHEDKSVAVSVAEGDRIAVTPGEIVQ
jgi:hypothetical protein